MTKHKSKRAPQQPIRLVFLGLVGLVLLVVILLQGVDVQLFNPKGLIANEQLKLMVLSVGIMLVIAIPTLTLFFLFAWKYRESNAKATYDAHTRRGKFFVFSIWAIPVIVMIVLASVMWSSTHRLAPQKAIASDAKPLTIQVVALRWKWLFIYPEQHVATVNFVQIPEDTPVRFEITADEAPMSSFWIPHLAGQLYAMTGHANLLNLMAHTPGDYPGRSAEINGAGFAGMEFTARVSSDVSFDQWVAEVTQSPNVLDMSAYKELLQPSENNKAAYYARPSTDLYATILAKYAGSHNHVELE